MARARRQVRRWCAHHRTTRLATLTFAEEPEDLDAGWKLIETFRRRLDDAGIAQPLIVPEWGSKNGRLHFHAAMPDYVPKDRLFELWGHGWVDIRKIRPKNQQGTRKLAGREQARICASYIAGYVTKLAKAGGGGPEAQPGSLPAIGPGLNRRRYSIPKSTSPEVVRFMCWDLYAAWTELQTMCGHRLDEVWHSPDDPEQWRGPPTMLLMG